MTAQYKFNVFTKKLDLVGTGGGPGSGIQTINSIGPDGGGNFLVESLDGSVVITPVANGIDLSVPGAGGAVTTFHIDNGGPITPIAGVITLNGVGGNETDTTGAGEIEVNNKRWFTKYVVDPSTTPGTNAEFTTIQSAINAAFADGGGDVNVRGSLTPYNEDLTFMPGVNVIAYTPDGRLGQFGGFGVTIQGHHTFTGNGVVAVKGIFFNTTGGTFLTMTNPAGIGLIGFIDCNITSSGAGVTVTNGGFAAIVSVLFGSVTTAGVICDIGAGCVFAGQEAQLQSTGGDGFTVTGQCSIAFGSLSANTNAINIVDPAGNVNVSNATIGAQTGVLFTAAGGAESQNVFWDCNGGSGFYIDGVAGNYNYSNDNIEGPANQIAPGITQIKAVWRPRAQAIAAAGNTPDYGVCAFDQSQFTLTDGFVQLSGGGGIVTSFDLDTGGPVSPVAGVITLNGIGGNITGTTGAGEIFVDNKFWLSGFVVDPNATPGSRGSFQTIQSAINAAFGGVGVAQIYIRPGTYTEDLVLHIGINLIGVGPDERSLAVGFNDDVVIVGVHSLTGEDGTVRLENLTFQSASATPTFTIDAGAASSELAITNSSINNTAGPVAFADTAGGVSAGLSMINCLAISSTDCLNFGAKGSFFVTNTEIVSTGGSGIISIQNAGLPGQINNCFIGASTFGIGMQGGNLIEATYNTINANIGLIFAANTPTLYSLHNTWNANDGGGDYVVGTVGTYNYADDILIGTAKGISGTVTSVPQTWKPFCTSGNTSTAVRGTASFDSTQFTVVDGFVQLVAAATFTWQRISGNQPTVSNNGYFCVSPGGTLSLSLPATAAIGDVVELNVRGATGFVLNQGVGQTIFIGANATTTGIAGSIASTSQGDSLRLVCSQTNTDWDVLSSVGSFTIV